MALCCGTSSRTWLAGGGAPSMIHTNLKAGWYDPTGSALKPRTIDTNIVQQLFYSWTVRPWSALISTQNGISAFAARSSCGSCVNDPIYLVAGVKAANRFANLFTTALISQVTINELGYANIGYVWSGSLEDGMAATASTLGMNLARESLAALNGGTGIFARSTSDLLRYDITRQILAISSELTMGGMPAPEPALVGLVAGACLLLSTLRRRRRR